MEAIGLRNRQKLPDVPQIVKTKISESRAQNKLSSPREPLVYIIDLSLPPKERYKRLAEDFKDEVTTLPFLFDEVVKAFIPNIHPKRIRILARLLLRRVYYKAETEELRGIHETTGVQMYLLVAFNVLLDLFMGCTSGGVKVDHGEHGSHMLHFRTLDWGMPALRKVIVQLNFVNKAGGPVIASSITYAGYVGVLTGVRKGLSMSLNFRPTHDASTRLINFRFYFHHLLVLFGWRPSISSVIRQCLIPSNEIGRRVAPDLGSIEKHIPGMKSTAAYLVFGDGQRTITMEKDYHTANVRSSSDFIAVTNHDAAEEERAASEQKNSNGNTSSQIQNATGMDILVEESIDRKACIEKYYQDAKKLFLEAMDTSSTDVGDMTVDIAQVTEWMKQYPITNEETHYATLMNPTTGVMTWKIMYPEELTKTMIKTLGKRIIR